VIAVSAGVIMRWNLNRTGWAGLSESEPRAGEVVAEGAD